MSDSEAFSAACDFVLRFGKYEGERIARIGASKEGLLYLDWLIGQKWVNGKLKESLDVYLRHPAISNQLNAYLDD